MHHTVCGGMRPTPVCGAQSTPRGDGQGAVLNPFNMTPHPRVVVGADPYGMRTCDARPYGLYIRCAYFLTEIWFFTHSTVNFLIPRNGKVRHKII